MPGIVGVLRKPDRAPVSLDTALRTLIHFDGYACRQAALGPHAAVGQVWRAPERSALDWSAPDACATARVFVNGSVFDGSRGRRLSAQEVLEAYLERRDLDPNRWDGSFIIVVADRGKDCLLICNDRLGALPLYYFHDHTALSFGPEVKAVLSALELEPRLSLDGVITFLACGYCLGETSLFEGIRVLEPATKMTVGLSSLAVRRDRYWKIVYRERPDLRSRPAAESALYSELVAAHKLILCDRPPRHDLLLSGGMDSRGILAVLKHLDALPHRTLGWGLRNDVPHSDPVVAAALAHRFGVRYDFYAYDSHTFAANARQWCSVSELANDNPGWCAEGAGVLADHFAQAACTLTGDECWGWQGAASNETEARAAVLPPKLPGPVHRMVNPARLAACEEAYDRQIRSVLRWCDNHQWDDRKDFLYTHGRLARFIFSLGYFKELATEIRRPFLTRNVLEIVAGLPRRFRWNKNLYLSMLSRFFPDAMCGPAASAHSLPDWPYDVRTDPALRGFFSQLLDSERVLSGRLGEILDAARYSALRDGFFSAAAVPVARATTRWRPWLSACLPEWAKLGIRKLRGPRKLIYENTFDCLCRVALLSLLEETLPHLGRPRRCNAP